MKMKNNHTLRRILMLLILLLVTATMAYAQQNISGEVKDKSGNAVIGANVSLQGTTKGALTDASGKFTIAGVAPGKYTLVMSFIGYKTVRQEVEVGSSPVTVSISTEEDLLSLDEVVVTGAFDERTKLESSVAITTLSPKLMDMRAPRGTGDLLQAVPGVWVDNSAGEVGNRVITRGVTPVGNQNIGFQYVSLQEEGLPVMASQLGFAVIDMFHRNDLTVARMEGIRGGSASIAVANAPGGIFNFISKTGGLKTAGSARLQTGIHNNGKMLYRADLEVGGPIANGWSYHVGGFYRIDEGARTMDFNANQGGQFKANISKNFARGQFRLYGKYLNDRNTFFKEIPLTADMKSGYGGFDIINSTTFLNLRTTIPDASRFRPEIPFDQLPTRTFDASKGITNKSFAFGANFDYDLGNNWGLSLAAKVSDFDQNYLQYQGNVTMSVVPSAADPGYGQFGAGAYPAIGSPIPGFLSPTYFDARTGEVLARVINGQLDPNTPNRLGRYLFATAPLNMNNQIGDVQGIVRLNKQAGKHNLTLGWYTGRTSMQTRWFVDGIAASFDGRPVRITFPFAGQTVQATDPNGFLLWSGLAYTVTDMKSNINAFFANDLWKVNDKLNIDLGLRFESVNHSGTKEGWRGGSTVTAGLPGLAALGGLDRNPLTSYDLGTRLYNGVTYNWNETYNYFSGSLGINYKISDKSATYVRFSRGNKAPELDYYANNFVNVPIQRGVIETVTQAEVGYKITSQKVSATVTGFYSYQDNVLLQLFITQGANSFFTDPTFNATRTMGVEIETIWQPVQNFNVRLSSTLQDPRFARLTYQNTARGTNPANFFNEDFSGKRVDFLPSVMFDVTPSYKVGKFTPYLNYRYFGKRYGNRRNTIELPAYGVLSAGIMADINRFNFALQGSNLLNSTGILNFSGYGAFGSTAEDLAVGGIRTPAGAVLSNSDITALNAANFPVWARPILGRQITLSVTYNF